MLGPVCPTNSSNGYRSAQSLIWAEKTLSQQNCVLDHSIFLLKSGQTFGCLLSLVLSRRNNSDIYLGTSTNRPLRRFVCDKFFVDRSDKGFPVPPGDKPTTSLHHKMDRPNRGRPSRGQIIYRVRLANFNLPNLRAGPHSRGIFPLVIEMATNTMTKYPVLLSTWLELLMGPVALTFKSEFFTIPCNLLPLMEEETSCGPLTVEF